MRHVKGPGGDQFLTRVPCPSHDLFHFPGRCDPMRLTARLLTLFLLLSMFGGLSPALAAPPDGTLVIGVHVTLVSRWLDRETEALITPFMVLYALHDALVKPMPGNINAPSLAESWTLAKDGVTYEFVLRKNAKFHNGDPVTAEDVKFSFDRYKGSGAKLLKDKVKEIQTPAPNRVRFILKEQWPDFMAFYGTSATGAGWIVPKKYIERVGEDAYKKAPVGAGPFKFAAFTPGIELTLDAFPDYWRKAPQVKRLVMRSIPDEATRAASVKTGEVDLAYLFGGVIASDLQRTPGVRVVAPLLYGIYWLDFLDQWDPKSPWHDRRVRLAASLAIDRQAINQAEMLGLGKAVAAFVPPEFDFALKMEPAPFDPKRPSSSWSRPATRTASTRASSPRCRLTPRWVRRSAAISRRSGSRPRCARWSAPRTCPTGGRRRSAAFSSGPPGRPATRPRDSSPSSPRTASTPTAPGRRSTISSSARPTSWIARSARRPCTRSRRSSPIRCWRRRSSSRRSPGAWGHASRSRRRA